MEVPQILYIDRAVDIQVVFKGGGGSFFMMEPVCVPEACDGSRDCHDIAGEVDLVIAG